MPHAVCTSGQVEAAAEDVSRSGLIPRRAIARCKLVSPFYFEGPGRFQSGSISMTSASHHDTPT
eukprot:7157705-Prymnesium_polylepis.1